MEDERKKLLLIKYISLLARELAERESHLGEKADLLSKLGVSHRQALKEGAKLALEAYDE
jgi:hypothetical protein